MTDLSPTEEMEDPALGSMTAIIDRAMREAGRDDVCIGHLASAFGRASFIPLMMLPAAAVVSPLSGIPLFSSICGIMILLIAVQLLVGRQCIWLPQWLQQRHIAGPRLERGLMRIKPLAAWLDRHAHSRLGLFFYPPVWFLLPILCAFAGGAMPFLELLPFTSSFLGMTVLLISLAMLTRDGLWVLVAMVPFLSAIALFTKLVIL
ncbi:exopolysaccharide biosynthesis protein [Tropicimonas sp. S265A]|uniref:exopolysaccharide biosynthesis protein n=1 Tax=Tropicimonas sp. S265A TaxID=3415134 RepID=UPI003C7A779A